MRISNKNPNHNKLKQDDDLGVYVLKLIKIV